MGRNVCSVVHTVVVSNDDRPPLGVYHCGTGPPCGLGRWQLRWCCRAGWDVLVKRLRQCDLLAALGSNMDDEHEVALVYQDALDNPAMHCNDGKSHFYAVE